jgi:phenylacetaldehyde dehydrogenase
MSGSERGRILYKYADLISQHGDELAALETFDNGKPLDMARILDIPYSVDIIRYNAGELSIY